MNYEDHERGFLREMSRACYGTNRGFLEVACDLDLRRRLLTSIRPRTASDSISVITYVVGFAPTEVIDWKTMPSADHDDYRRNVGVRGTMTAASP